MDGDVSGVFSMASLSMRRLPAGMQAISRRPRLLLAIARRLVNPAIQSVNRND